MTTTTPADRGEQVDTIARANETSWAWSFSWLMVYAMLLSGLIHVPMFALGEREWEDPISFRKPILFGISTGLTLGSMLWVLRKLTPRRWDSLLRDALSVSLAIEVFLITMQTWRSARSHFNTEGWFNCGVEAAMLLMISIASGIILVIAWRSWQDFSKPSVSPMQSAIWHGMNLLVASVALGYAITLIGKQLIANGVAPEIVPPGGVLKFPHGAGLHAIQALPFMAWATHRARQRLSLAAVRWGAWTYYSFVTFSIVQTARGRERLDLDSFSTLLFAMVGLTGCICGVYFLRSLLSIRSTSQPSL
ncbi:hypothetical protein SH467x_003057 [Pirellulaceae bacterium SH467]